MDDATRCPLLVTPNLEARPWGGRRLVELAGEAGAPEGPVGEAWLAGEENVVAAGPFAGVTLGTLAAGHGAAFVGRTPAARYGHRMPVLVKLLDAREALSVQVHPDDAAAARLRADPPHLGKSEVWLVLDAEPTAVVQWGWRRTVGVDEVRRAAASGEIMDLLREVPVHAGDVVLNEAGVVHAIAGGVLLYELQQASDLTYRLYDHGRVDRAGEPRALHLDEALQVARLTPGDRPGPRAEVWAPGRTRLVRCDAFTLERWEVGGEAPAVQRWQVRPDTLEVWTVLGGSARLAAGGVELALTRWQTVVLPASVGPAVWEGCASLARGTAG